MSVVSVVVSHYVSVVYVLLSIVFVVFFFISSS